MQTKEQAPFTLEPNAKRMRLHDIYGKHTYLPLVSDAPACYIYYCPGCGDVVLQGIHGTRYGTLHDFFIQEYIDVRHRNHGIPIDQAKLEVAKLLQARSQVDAQV